MAFPKLAASFLACAAALPAFLLPAAPARAQSGYVEHVWQDHGDWALYLDRRAIRLVLVNALPKTRLARIACASEVLGADPKEMGVADVGRAAAEGLLAQPDAACIVLRCFWNRPQRGFTLLLNVARHAGEAVTAPGRFSLYRRLGTDSEREIFASAPARGPAAAPDGSIVLDAFSFQVKDAASPIALHLSANAEPAFVRALAGPDQLVFRIPPGRDARGRPELDVVHAGRSAAFGLAGTQAALDEFERLCQRR
ncbi:MAG: hypothetical protein JNM29_06950 [Candidatus Odyssella sp.]|nr:hypothetical protein [Candidatus Odyssella sp.]